MDWFMIICYLLILLAILTNVLITVLLRGSESEQLFARRLASRVRYVVWFFGPGLFTFLFFPTKLLYVPFLCIILPSVLALGIRALRMKYRHTMAKRQPRAKPDSDSSDSSYSDNEYDPPTPLTDTYEFDTRTMALKDELGRVQQERLFTGSVDSDRSD